MTAKSSTVQIVSYLLPLSLFFFILLFLPVTPNFFDTPKQTLALVSLAIVFSTYLISVFFKREYEVPRSRILVPSFIFIAVLILNLILYKEARTEAIYGAGSLYIVATLLGLAATFVSDNTKVRVYTLISFLSATALLAVHSLLQLIVLYKQTFLPAYMQIRTFTPTGSVLTTLTLLIMGSIVAYLAGARLTRGNTQYLAFGVGIIETIAAVAYIALLFPGGSTIINILPYGASWSLTLDALKSLQSFFFGIGLANFPTLFTAFKPLSLNTTIFWNTTPAGAGSEFLQILATTGVTGLVAFIALSGAAFAKRTLTSSLDFIYLAMASASIIALLLTPATLPIVFVLFVALGMATPASVQTVKIANYPRYVLVGIGAMLVIGSLYLYGRFALAEFHMHRAQMALANNDGKAVYDENLKAILLMPSLSNYHLSYSQVNLSLASALSQKGSLSDDEKTQVTTLISQAIRDGKQAASLHPSDVRVWVNLGTIYRNLINVAQGSDQFAVSAYQQAISLDPGNPELRLDYAGLLYQLSGSAKDDDTKKSLLSQSISQFNMAVQLKPDYANAYYNLSKALEATGNTTDAYAAMQKAVASLDPSSPDLSTATADLEALKSKLPKASPTPSESSTPSATPSRELTQPSPLPSPIEGGPITVPDASPNP